MQETAHMNGSKGDTVLKSVKLLNECKAVLSRLGLYREHDIDSGGRSDSRRRDTNVETPHSPSVHNAWEDPAGACMISTNPYQLTTKAKRAGRGGRNSPAGSSRAARSHAATKLAYGASSPDLMSARGDERSSDQGQQQLPPSMSLDSRFKQVLQLASATASTRFMPPPAPAAAAAPSSLQQQEQQEEEQHASGGAALAAAARLDPAALASATSGDVSAVLSAAAAAGVITSATAAGFVSTAAAAAAAAAHAPSSGRHISQGGMSHASWGTPSATHRPSGGGAGPVPATHSVNEVMPRTLHIRTRSSGSVPCVFSGTSSGGGGGGSVRGSSGGQLDLLSALPATSSLPVRRCTRPGNVPPLDLSQLPDATASTDSPAAAPATANGKAKPQSKQQQQAAAAAAQPQQHRGLDGAWNESEEEVQQEMEAYAAPAKWYPTHEGRWYVYKPVSTQEVQRYEALLSSLSPDQASQVASMWNALIQARYSCELMASRAVRVTKDVSSEWADMSCGLLERIDGYEHQVAALKEFVEHQQQQIDQYQWQLQQLQAAHRQQAAAAGAAGLRHDSGSHRGLMGMMGGAGGRQQQQMHGSGSNGRMEDAMQDQLSGLSAENTQLSCENAELHQELHDVKGLFMQASDDCSLLQQQLAAHHDQTRHLWQAHQRLLRQQAAMEADRDAAEQQRDELAAQVRALQAALRQQECAAGGAESAAPAAATACVAPTRGKNSGCGCPSCVSAAADGGAPAAAAALLQPACSAFNGLMSAWASAASTPAGGTPARPAAAGVEALRQELHLADGIAVLQVSSKQRAGGAVAAAGSGIATVTTTSNNKGNDSADAAPGGGMWQAWAAAAYAAAGGDVPMPPSACPDGDPYADGAAGGISALSSSQLMITPQGSFTGAAAKAAGSSLASCGGSSSFGGSPLPSTLKLPGLGVDGDQLLRELMLARQATCGASQQQ